MKRSFKKLIVRIARFVGKKDSTRRTGTHFIVFFLISLAARAYAEYSADGWGDADAMLLLRGIASDFTVSLSAAILLRLIPLRLVIHIFYFLWAGFAAGNIVHIAYNIANIDFGDTGEMGEGDFVKGSVLSSDVLVPWLVFWIAAEIIPFICQWAVRRFSIRVPRLSYPAALALGCIMLYFFSTSLETSYWRQYNVWEENLTQRVASDDSDIPEVPQPQADAAYKAYTALDLSGEPILKPYDGKPNILIITIEGMSNYHLNKGYMPYLQQLAAENIYYPNYVYTQQFTRNGLFSMLCNDYATFEQRYVGKGSSIDRWYTAISPGPLKPCLPQILSKNGYQTVYFQASSLNYDNKNKFMTAMGFQKMHGATGLKSWGDKNQLKHSFLGWGMSDDMFFTSISNYLIDLEKKKGDKPWFAMMMTTGTHPPYDLPSGYGGNRYGSRQEAAFHAADDYIKYLLDALDKQGILDHTLVFIEGDESRTRVNKKDVSSILAGNWGVMVIKTPQKTNYTSSEIFAQPDVAVSILDYLGMSTDGHHFRSLFRSYENRFRPLMFAAAHIRRWFDLVEQKDGFYKLVICTTGFRQCQEDGVSTDLFNAPVQKIDSRDDIALAVAVAKKSDQNARKKNDRDKVKTSDFHRLLAHSKDKDKDEDEDTDDDTPSKKATEAKRHAKKRTDLGDPNQTKEFVPAIIEARIEQHQKHQSSAKSKDTAAKSKDIPQAKPTAADPAKPPRRVIRIQRPKKPVNDDVKVDPPS